MLISKVKDRKRITGFWSISFCNTVYKFISKTLTIRLQKHLSCLIDPAQSAFLRDRLIKDNALLAM